MPAGSPFTRLCQRVSAEQSRRSDLHIHSTYSDGTYTPTEIVNCAVRCRLLGFAITDHDTMAGYLEAVKIIEENRLSIEVIPGVELTCVWQGREFHLLGYFLDASHRDLQATLSAIRQRRVERLQRFCERLARAGMSFKVEDFLARLPKQVSLGRRHLADWLVRCGQARSQFQVFRDYLQPRDPAEAILHGIPIEQGIRLIHDAGGISSWAHPPTSATMEQLRCLQDIGLDAVECVYPWSRSAHGKMLRTMAEAAGLGVTGGSDCHGPQPHNRAIGSRSITRDELQVLRNIRSAHQL